MRAALFERPAADEILVATQVDGEPDACLERVDLVVVLVAGGDEAGLDAHHVECVEAERSEAEVAARLPHGVPHRRAVARVAEDLIAELAGVSGARNHDRGALPLVDSTD